MDRASVNVICLDVDSITPSIGLRLQTLLDPTERQIAARFAFDADRRAYGAAHALLRVALCEYAEGAPTDWRFDATPLGKPFLATQPAGLDLRFSLSHAHSLVAVAIAQGFDIGVDVEASDRSSAHDMDIADRCFTPEEATLLRSLADAQQRQDLFLTLWTLKEAVVKATGEGLSRPLDSFSIACDTFRLTARADANAPPPSEWSLAHWRRRRAHVAVAAQCANARIVLADRDAAALLG